jgi:Holliday junction resolvase-like predicted endonuclease
MGSSNGAYAEDYFANAMEEKMEFAGQKYTDIARNMNKKTKSKKDEFDIVLYNGESVAIIEIKYKARTEDLEQMVDKKVPNFRALFPYYKDYKVYLGLGSMSFSDRVSAKAHELIYTLYIPYPEICL